MKKLVKSVSYAMKGIRTAFATERNLRIQGVAAVVVILIGLYVHLQTWEWVWILFCIALVLGFEMMNTAVENLVDLVTREQHPIAGRIKDIAAGAVQLVAMIVALIGLIIFWPHFF